MRHDEEKPMKEEKKQKIVERCFLKALMVSLFQKLEISQLGVGW